MNEQSGDWSALEDRLGYRFRDRRLLQEALTHASRQEVHNERLEFLGDAVLNLIVAEELFRRFPAEREGRLTVLKSRLVSRDALSRAGERLGLAGWIRTGGSLEKRHALPRSLLGNALEAVLGATYVDGGPAEARAAVARWLADDLDNLERASARETAKQTLQLYAQRSYGRLPQYRVLETYEHPLTTSFCVAVELNGHRFPAAWGSSKKEAERWAAWEAILALRAEGAPVDHAG